MILHDPKTDPAETMFDAGQREALEQSGLKLRLATRLNDEVGRFDVTYINAIAWVGDGFEVHGSNFQLSSDTDFKEGSIVLHPLARGRELCSSLDETPTTGISRKPGVRCSCAWRCSPAWLSAPTKSWM